MSTPAENIWTLHSNDPNGKDLNGCHIVFDGTTYELTEPDPKKVLASMLGPIIPFTFPVFTYKDTEWAIVLWRLSNQPGKDRNDGNGTQSGDFTAMNGGAGVPEATYRAKA